MRKFTGGIEKATKAVFALAAAVEATALTVAYGVQKFASNLEQLYFSAQRTGASATQLKAFDKAAQNLGASAGEALDSLEGMAQLFRENPTGTGGLLATLGVQLKYAKDGTVDVLDATLQLQDAFQKMPQYMALQYAKQLQLSDHMFLAIRSGKIRDEFARMQKEMRGNGFDKAAEDAHKFMMQMRDLETTIEAFGAKVLDALQNKLGWSIQKLNAWIQANGDKITDKLIDGIEKLWHAAQYIIDTIKELIKFFIALDHATGGWSTKILAIGALLQLSGAGSIVGGILSLTSAFIGLTGAVAAAVGAFAVFSGYELAQAIRGKETLVSKGMDWIMEKLTGQKGTSLGSWLYDITHRDEEAMQFFTNRGWSSAQAAGIVANLRAESGLRTSAVGDNGQAVGLAQWHPDRQLDFSRITGKNIGDSSFEDQLGFVDWELRHSRRFAGDELRNANDAESSARIVSRFFEGQGLGMAEENRRASMAAGIQQQITVNVNGADDPHRVANKVVGVIKRETADLTRSAAGQVQ